MTSTATTATTRTEPATRTRRSGGCTRTRRLGLACVATTALLVPAVAAAPAHAINPAQTTTSGVVSLLGGTSTGSIATFWTTTMRSWGYTYTAPKLWYYNLPSAPGPVATSCGTLSVNNSFYCSSSNGIYLDVPWNQSLIYGYGDFGSGGVLAHEWGHAIDAWLGYNTRSTAYTTSGYRNEYHADCLAGIYVRNGYATGRLNGSDYGEFYNWLYSRAWSTSHGYGPTRAAWYEYGYTQYSLSACNKVYSLPATPSATGATAATGEASDTAAIEDRTRTLGTVPTKVAGTKGHRPGLGEKHTGQVETHPGTVARPARVPAPPAVGDTPALPARDRAVVATPPSAALGGPRG
ncbi:MAG: neutral zinc metallopeptidase [Kineosporiaceae bacterium]